MASNLKKKIINTILNSAEINQSSCFGVQARDPSVHAAILAHLNQKYGSGSGADPSSPEKNKVVSRANSELQGFAMLECEGRVDRQNPDIQTKNTSFMHQSDCYCGVFFTDER